MIQSDGLVKLMYALPAQYRNQGTWAMNGTTLALVRLLKDGQGNYLWQPFFQAGQPETILGRPVVEMPDMPDVANGTFPIMFGDFSGYRIVDRLALSILVNAATIGRGKPPPAPSWPKPAMISAHAARQPCLSGTSNPFGYGRICAWCDRTGGRAASAATRKTPRESGSNSKGNRNELLRDGGFQAVYRVRRSL